MNINFTQFRILNICILMLVITISGSAQLTKEWEINKESGLSSYPSHNLIYKDHLDTKRASNGDFITLLKRSENQKNIIQVIRYTTNGDEVWTFEKQSDEEFAPSINSIAIDNEDNIILGGNHVTEIFVDFDIFAERADFYMIKISSSGDEMWEITIPSLQSEDEWHVDFCNDVEVGTDNTIYATGRISDLATGVSSVLIKFSEEGDIIWTTPLGSGTGLHISILDDEIQVLDKSSDHQISYVDNEGNITSQYVIPDLVSFRGVVDEDGNIFTHSTTGKYKITKYDIQGSIIWEYEKPTNLPSNVNADELRDIFLAEDGTIYTTGRYYGEHYGDTSLYTNCDILTTHLSSEGEAIWENIYNFDGERSCQVGNKITVDDEGNAIVVGYQSVTKNGNIFGSEDMVILRYNDEGVRTDSIYYNTSSNDDDTAINVQTEGSDIYVQGWSTQDDIVQGTLLKYSVKTAVNNLISNDFTIYPNPSNGIFSLNSSSLDGPAEIKIFDMTGKVIAKSDLSDTDETIDVQTTLAPGIYIVSIKSSNAVGSKKLIIQ